MAVDAFIFFVATNKDQQPMGETTDTFFSTKGAFEIKEFSFDIENPTTIGSATKGAGGGKAKFNEFTIKKPTDQASTMFFKNACSGVHYKSVVIAIRKASGTADTTGSPYLMFEFDLVFTTKIEWSGPGEEGPEEGITFAFGKLGILYNKQSSDDATMGQLIATRTVGWDQTKNVEIGADVLKFTALVPAT